MRSWSTRKKIIVIFSAAMLMRMVALVSFEDKQSLIFNDSRGYIQVAQNLLEHGIYSANPGPNPQPDSFRTPILPLFLMPFLHFKLSLYWIAVVNDILMALAAVLLFFLGRRLFNEKAAFIAAILSGLEPYGALISNQILTEAPFTLIFTLSLLLLGLYIKERKFDYLYFGSFLLAVSALTRPVAFPLFILIPIAVLLEKFTKRLDEKTVIFKKQKMPWEELMVALLVFIVVISPWLAFNRMILKIWSFSTVTNFNLYHQNATSFNEWLIENEKISADGDDILPYLKETEDAFSPEKADEYFNTAKTFIMKRPLEYAGFIFLKFYRLFLYSGYENIADGIMPGHSGEWVSRFKSDLLKLDLAAAAKTLKNQPEIILILAGEIFFIVVSILAFLNLFIHIRKKTLNPYYHTLFFLALAIYGLLLSPTGGARYRIPINPILFLLALDSLAMFIGRHLKKPEIISPPLIYR